MVSHSHTTLGWPISIRVQKIIPFYLNDPVLRFSQPGYQIEGVSLWMHSEFFLTLGTFPYRTEVALRKPRSVKNVYKLAFMAEKNNQ